MKKDKAAYYINYGLAPFFKEKMTEKVGKSDLLVLSFDESLNDITQTGEMVVMIRFWDTSESIVKTRTLRKL